MAKLVAREIGHAASDSATDLGLAATRKVRELGERRKQRRAEKYHATAAAERMANEAGIDLAEVEGSDSELRITVKVRWRPAAVSTTRRQIAARTRLYDSFFVTRLVCWLATRTSSLVRSS